jgi:hypothetical protein
MLREIEESIPQGSVLGSALLYELIYPPTSNNTTAAIFTDDTATLARREEPAVASMKLQVTVSKIYDWANKWRIKIKQSEIHAYYIHPIQSNLSGSANGHCCSTPKYRREIPEHASW